MTGQNGKKTPAGLHVPRNSARAAWIIPRGLMSLLIGAMLRIIRNIHAQPAHAVPCAGLVRPAPAVLSAHKDLLGKPARPVPVGLLGLGARQVWQVRLVRRVLPVRKAPLAPKAP